MDRTDLAKYIYISRQTVETKHNKTRHNYATWRETYGNNTRWHKVVVSGHCKPGHNSSANPQLYCRSPSWRQYHLKKKMYVSFLPICSHWNTFQVQNKSREFKLLNGRYLKLQQDHKYAHRFYTSGVEHGNEQAEIANESFFNLSVAMCILNSNVIDVTHIPK